MKEKIKYKIYILSGKSTMYSPSLTKEQKNTFKQKVLKLYEDGKGI